MTNKASAALSGLGMVAVAGLLAACGSGSGIAGYGGAQAAQGHRAVASRGPVVTARKVAGIGVVLTDQSGRTIYSPEQEAHGKILCTGSCLGFWFPVSVTPGTPLRAPAGVGGMLGTIRRPDDGLTQLTFDGKPLYTFRLDQASGQAHGNNFSDHFGSVSFTWHAVTSSGAAEGTSQPQPPASSSPGTGYSPGYGG